MNPTLAIRPFRSSLRRPRLLALAVAALFTAPAAFAQSTLFSIDGDQAGGGLAAGGIAPVGDVDGDGYPDFLTGDPLYDGKAGIDCGRAQLFSCAKQPPVVLATWEGLNAGDRLGSFVRDLHDIDGDGFDDFAISSVGYPSGTDQGRIEVWSGHKLGLLYTIDGEAAGDRFGRVCGVGDATADGIPDVLASAVGWNSNAGRVYLFSGKDGSRHKLWDGIQAGDELGFRLAAMNADVLGDKGLDFAMTARKGGMTPPGGGRIEIHSGQVGFGTCFKSWSTVPGDAQAYVSDALDYDGDGWPEYLIAAPGKNGGNGWIELRTTYNFFSHLHTWDGTAALPYDGDTVMAGDTDRDGRGDFLFSSLGCDGLAGPDVGAAVLVSGANWRELTRKSGPDTGAAMGGESMAFAGDLNGDKRPDFLAAAPNADLPGLDKAGQLRAYTGNDLYLTLSHEVAYAGDDVTITTTGGAPGKTVIIACTEIDGIPFFIPLLSSIVFDGNGEYFLTLNVISAYVGHDYRFQSFALPATGRKLEVSGSIPLSLR